MRILLVSDLHYALRQLDWTLATAPRVDAVVIAGDLLDISSLVEGSVQIVVILKYLQRLAQCGPLIVSSGNQDLDVRDDSGEKVARWMNQVRQLGIPTDGDTTTLGSTLVTVCPWWDGPHARQAVQQQLERDSARPRTSWLWVYHAPPAGSPTCWDGRHAYGDTELTAWIKRYQPDLVFSGHIHQAPFEAGGSWADRIGLTWIFNCGRQSGPEPCHILIDTQARAAAWFSLAGAEMLHLDQPLARPFAELADSSGWLRPRPRDLDPSPV